MMTLCCVVEKYFYKYIKNLKNILIQLLISLYETSYIILGRGLELNNLF